MILSLFLVTQASILSLSVRGCEFSERTRKIIQDEVSLRAEAQGQSGTRSETLTLQHSYFRKLNGEWTLSADADERYWDQKWGSYNCYSYAMQRYDIVPEYFQSIVTPSRPRWYQPGVISSVYVPNILLDVSQLAEAVVSDFEVMGYTNVSAFQFTGVLPTLGTDEELIAVRTPEPVPYDYHFMRYNKADGCWYHFAADGTMDELTGWTTDLAYTDREAEPRVGYHYYVRCSKHADGADASPVSPAGVGYKLSPILDEWDPADDTASGATPKRKYSSACVGSSMKISRWSATMMRSFPSDGAGISGSCEQLLSSQRNFM